MIYLFSDIRLFLLFIFVIFLFLPAELFFVTLLVTVREFLPILLDAVTSFNNVSIIFAVRRGLVFSFPYNLYSFSHIYHICSTFPWYDVHITPSLGFFHSFWLDNAFILSYLAYSLFQILSIFNISILSSNLSSRFSIVLSYYSIRLDSMWFIIFTSSIITPNILNHLSIILAQ